ncbi:MAG: MinD/ParA family protein [Candidatus Hermodarchaeota archaeon]
MFKTLLIEADFFAPSLNYLRLSEGKYWNDYLLGNCNAEEIIHSISNIDVVYTKPNDPSFLGYIHDRNLWTGQFSNRILEFLAEYKDYYFILIDNQSGRFLSSITHSSFADYLICMVRPDKSDVIATASYLKSLKKDYYLVWNQVLTHPQMNEIITEWTEEYFNPQEGYQGTFGLIPFDEATAFQRWVDGKIFIKETQYAGIIEEIAKKNRYVCYGEEKRAIITLFW